MNCPSNKEVDHIDGDTFNNQRSNLEIVDKRENIFREQHPLFRPNSNHQESHDLHGPCKEVD